MVSKEEIEKFNKKMSLYFEAGIVREVYRTNNVCIISIGELCYVACSYVLAGETPFGCYVNEDIMRALRDNDKLIYPVIANSHKDESLIYYFPSDEHSILKWHEWIKANKKGPSEINYGLEGDLFQPSPQHQN